MVRKRPVKPDDLRLWATVAATLRPHRGRSDLDALKAAIDAAEIEEARLRAEEEERERLAKIPKGLRRRRGPQALPRPTHAPDVTDPYEAPFVLSPFEIGILAKEQAKKAASPWGPDPIEPKRKKRIVRERDPIEARLDLHGYTQFSAEDRLKSFLLSAHAQGYRSVLVITGKGLSGDGIIRRRIPEWLGAPELSHVVAGFSLAHRRHGGDGALYVALKRRG